MAKAVIEQEKVSGEEKVVTINKKADYMVVEGTEKSFFVGKLKVVHKILGEKLIKSGNAKKSDKTPFEIVDNEERTVKEVNP